MAGQRINRKVVNVENERPTRSLTMPMPAARMVMTRRGGCIGESIRRRHQHNVATDWEGKVILLIPIKV